MSIKTSHIKIKDFLRGPAPEMSLGTGRSKKILISFSIVIIALIPITTKADGGITISVEAPQAEKRVNLPSQTAIIGWDGVYETMALSTGVKAEDLSDLAWIIPVPSKTKPEVEKADIEIFQQVPYLFSEIKVERKGKGGGIEAIIFLIIVALVALFVLLRKKRSKIELVTGGVLIILILLLIGIVLLVSLGGTMGGLETEVSPIEVIETKKVGIYDIVILKATDAEYMVNWLNREGYEISDENIPILQDYCDQANFYFIVNKINQEALNKKDLLEGIATPLKMKFRPEKPFYPLKMSAINGGQTAIEVYFFSDKPVRDESGTLLIKKSRDVGRAMLILYDYGNKEIKLAMDRFYSSPYSTWNVVTWLRYEGDLENLEKDAYFKFDSTTCESLPKSKEIQQRLFSIEVTSEKCFEILAEKTAEPVPSDLSRGKSREVEEWKTYRNEEYGFEIKYPDYFTDERAIGDNILAMGRVSEDNASAELLTILVLPGEQFDEFETTDGIRGYIFKFSREQGEWIFIPSNYSSEEDLKNSLVPVIPKQYITKKGLVTYVGGAGTFHGTQGRSVSEIGLIENRSNNFVVEITITRCQGTENACGVWQEGSPPFKPNWFSNEETIFSVLDTFEFK